MPKIHELKCLGEHFDAVRDGRKRFELRINDRGFQVGDLLLLKRTTAVRQVILDPRTGQRHVVECVQEDHPPVTLLVEVSHILPGGQYGLAADYCVMSIKPPEMAYAHED